jgi:hypothetical protein
VDFVNVRKIDELKPKENYSVVFERGSNVLGIMGILKLKKHMQTVS